MFDWILISLTITKIDDKHMHMSTCVDLSIKRWTSDLNVTGSRLPFTTRYSYVLMVKSPNMFNFEKLLFCFIKLCKCTHKYKKLIFSLENVRDGAPPPERPKIWYPRFGRYLNIYLSYDYSSIVKVGSRVRSISGPLKVITDKDSH